MKFQVIIRILMVVLMFFLRLITGQEQRTVVAETAERLATQVALSLLDVMERNNPLLA